MTHQNGRFFENTHDAIIDEETFKTVQRIRDGRRKVSRLGNMGILSGMMFCADCGNKLYQFRGKAGNMIKNILYAPPTAKSRVATVHIKSGT